MQRRFRYNSSWIFITRLKKKTCVYDAHEYFTEVPEVVNRKMTKAVWERVAQMTIPKLPYAYTVSQSLATELTHRYGVDFKVVRNVPFQYQPVDDFEKSELIKKYNLPQHSNQTILLYQGALNEGRGIEQVFEAIQDMDNVELWLAGEGDLSEMLRLKAQAMRLRDRVHFLGFVTPKDLIVLTRLADIGLNLLENKGKSYYFSLANKTFDYIQAEKPALHPDFPEYRWLNEQHQIGVLVPDLSKEKIANSIEKLTTDKLFYQYLVKNCQQAKQEYIWEKEEITLLEIYEKVKQNHSK